MYRSLISIQVENFSVRATKDIEKIRLHNKKLQAERDRYARDNMLVGHKAKQDKYYSEEDMELVHKRKIIYEGIEKLIKENEEYIQELIAERQRIYNSRPKQLRLWENLNEVR